MASRKKTTVTPTVASIVPADTATGAWARIDAAAAILGTVLPKLSIQDAVRGTADAMVLERTGIVAETEQHARNLLGVRQTALKSLTAFWTRTAPVTPAVFNAIVRPMLYDMLVASKAYGKDANESAGSVNSALVLYSTAIVALSHGSWCGVSLLPLPTEELRAYKERVLPLMSATNDTVKEPLMVKKNSGRPATDKAPAAAPVPMLDAATGKPVLDDKGNPVMQAAPQRAVITVKQRQLALQVLCNSDQADMMMLDTLTQNMDALRNLYKILYPIKTA